jgi:hypothetical protein
MVLLRSAQRGDSDPPRKKAHGAIAVVPRAFTFCIKLQLLKSVNELLPLFIVFDVTTRSCLAQGKNEFVKKIFV